MTFSCVRCRVCVYPQVQYLSGKLNDSMRNYFGLAGAEMNADGTPASPLGATPQVRCQVAVLGHTKPLPSTLPLMHSTRPLQWLPALV